MTFPTTGILDAFARANGALGPNWDSPILSGNSPLEISSDTVLPSDDTVSTDGYWTTPFAVPIECYFTVGTFVGNSGAPGLWACVTNEGTGSISGYHLGTQNANEVYLDRWDEGSNAENLLDITGLSLGTGDGFGISIGDAGAIEIWHAPGGTGWTSLGTATDATYTAGKSGLAYFAPDSSSAPFTEFGGSGESVATAMPVVSKRGLYLTPTDLTGAPLGSPGKPAIVRTPEQPQVTIPLSDSRTGTIAVNMYDKVAGALDVATAALKVLYINPKGDSMLVLNGIVLSKVDDFDASTTTAQIHDPTIRLKKRNLGYGHISIELGYGETISDGSVDDYTGGSFNGVNSDYGIPLDGKGLRLMMYDAAHGTADRGVSAVPGLHIRPGDDDSTPQPGYGDDGVPPPGVTGFTATATEGSDTLTDVSFTDATWTGEGSPTISDILEYMRLVGPAVDGVSVIPQFGSVVGASGTSIVMNLEAAASVTAGTFTAEDAIYCQLSRGDCVYDDVTDIVQAQGSFECDWLPIDKDHLGHSGSTWESGQMAELYTANRIGSDRSKGNTEGNVPVQFVHGIGGFHVTHAPDADSLITYVVECGPGGPADPLDLYNKVEFEAETIETYGIWEAWEQATAAGTGDTPISNALLTDRAAAVLTAYQDPPQFITATIDRDVVSRYAFGTDFFIGDTVTVYAKKGSVTLGPLAVRITEVGITRVDENGNCQIDLTLVPYLTANPGIGPDNL